MSTPERLLKWLLIGLTALLPLKFASLLLPGTPSGAPDGWVALLVTPYPAAWLVAAAGVLLILSAWAVRPGWNFFRGAAGWTALLWLALAWCGPWGLIRASSAETGVLFTVYFLGLGGYAVAVHLLLTRHPEAGWQLAAALVAGMLAVTAIGIRQYFYGFDELREFVLAQEKLYGFVFSSDFKARLWDVRTYGTFTFAGGLAGALLLTGALVVERLWCAGGRIEPARVSRWLLAGTALAALALVLATTKARGAYLALILAALLSGVASLRSRRLKVAVVVAALAAIAGGALYIHCAGRGFSSMTERVGYLATSAKMLVDAPFFGGGWGDFTHEHALFKFMGNHELAKDPHNILASFASQCGVPGLLLVLALLLVPWVAGARRLARHRREHGRYPGFTAALFFGMTAFYFHAFMDLDLLVPASLAMLALVQLLLMDAPESGAVKRRGGVWTALFLSVYGLAAVAGGGWWALADGRLDALQTATGQAVNAPGVRPELPSAVRLKLERAAAVMPFSPSPWLMAGNYHMMLRDWAGAEACYRAAQQRSPEFYLIYGRLAEVLDRQGRTAEARTHYDEALRRFPLNNKKPEVSFRE